jgi:hypothetical protein
MIPSILCKTLNNVYLTTVYPAFGFWHHADVGCIANVSDVLTVSILMAK